MAGRSARHLKIRRLSADFSLNITFFNRSLNQSTFSSHRYILLFLCFYYDIVMFRVKISPLRKIVRQPSDSDIFSIILTLCDRQFL